MIVSEWFDPLDEFLANAHAPNDDLGPCEEEPIPCELEYGEAELQHIMEMAREISNNPPVRFCVHELDELDRVTARSKAGLKSLERQVSQ